MAMKIIVIWKPHLLILGCLFLSDRQTKRAADLSIRLLFDLTLRQKDEIMNMLQTYLANLSNNNYVNGLEVGYVFDRELCEGGPRDCFDGKWINK